jgi:branched-subunit amino acid permease
MEKIIAKVNALLGKLYPTWLVGQVAEDKFLHFICGFIIAAVLTPFIGWYSVLVVSIIATAKELYDDMNKDTHTADVWDLLVTIAGGALGYSLVSLF